jgi:hypothetical protein
LRRRKFGKRGRPPDELGAKTGIHVDAGISACQAKPVAFPGTYIDPMTITVGKLSQTGRQR